MVRAEAQSPARGAAEPWIAGGVVEIEARDLLDDHDGTEPQMPEAWSGWLSNNVRAHVVPLASESGQAAVGLMLASGSFDTHNAAGRYEWMMSQAAAAMLTELASGENQIGALLRDSGWRVSATANNGVLAIQAAGPGDERSLEQVLRALALMLDRPTWTPAGLTRWRERARAEYVAGQTDPRAALNRALNRVIGTPTWDAERLDTPELFSPGRIEAWLAQRVARAPMTVALSGPVERSASMELLAHWIGGLGVRGDKLDAQSEPRRPRITPRMPGAWNLGDAHGIERTIGVRTTSNQHAMVLRGVAGPPSDQIDTARRLRQSRRLLRMRTRSLLDEQHLEIERLSTGMIFGDREGGRSLLWVVAEVEPEYAGQVREVLDRAVGSLGTHPMDDAALEALSKRTDEQLAGLTRNPAYWVDRLTASDLSGMPVLSAHALREAYAAISGEEIAAVMRTLSSKSHRIALSVVPEADSKERPRP